MRDDLHKSSQSNTYDVTPSASHRPIRWRCPSLKDPKSIPLSCLSLHFLMHSFLISSTAIPHVQLKAVHASKYLIYPEKAAHSLNIFHLPSIPILPSFDSLLHIFRRKSYMLLSLWVIIQRVYFLCCVLTWYGYKNHTRKYRNWATWTEHISISTMPIQMETCAGVASLKHDRLHLRNTSFRCCPAKRLQWANQGMLQLAFAEFHPPLSSPPYFSTRMLVV